MKLHSSTSHHHPQILQKSTSIFGDQQQLSRTTTKSGFTMVEFTISMGFIAILLVAIAIISSNMIALYQKGLVVKSIDDVGRSLINEFSLSISASPSVDTASLCARLTSTTSSYNSCLKDRANKYVFQQRSSSHSFSHEGSAVVQTAGMFCTGKYSYLWNTFYSRPSSTNESRTVGGIQLRYKSASGTNQTIKDFRLIRIDDPTHRACSSVVTSSYNTNSTFTNGNATWTIDVTKLSNGADNPIDSPTTGFLHGSSLDLELYELTFYPISQDLVTLRTFMSGTFILATDRGNINVTRTNNYCDVNNYLGDGASSSALDLGSELNYCAINKFNFAARTAGK